MKITDFTIKLRNVAGDGEPEELGEWKNASGGNLIAVAEKGGHKYQIKIHAKPKFYFVDSAISEKRNRLAASGDDEERERLQREIDSLMRTKPRYDREDGISSEFVQTKAEIFSRINGAHNPHLVCSESIWTEPIEMRGSAVYPVEAAPWVDCAVGFDGAELIDFRRDLSKDDKYELIASLADAVAELHALGIVHGDLKIGNTIIIQEGSKKSVALIDYDAAFIVDDLKNKRHCFDIWDKLLGGTFFSPELLEVYDLIADGDEEGFEDIDLSAFSTKSDIFSLGVTIYEYLYERADMNILPFKGPDGSDLTDTEYASALKRGFKPNFPSDPGCTEMDGLVYGMLNWMLDPDPAARPDAETVARVFRTKNESLIPGKYCRIDLHAPWEEDGIEWTGVPGVDIIRIANKPGRYFVTKAGGARINCNRARLIEDGYARDVSGRVDPNANKNLLWDSDGSGVLPACLERGSEEGKYNFVKNKLVIRTYTYEKLKEIGFFCGEDKLYTLWPEDERIGKLTIKSSHVVKRDFSRGPGHYLVQSKADNLAGKKTFMHMTYQGLIDNGYTIKGIECSPCWDGDNITFLDSAMNDGVMAITRHVIKGPGYYIVTKTDGTKERGVSVDTLISRGWASRR